MSTCCWQSVIDVNFELNGPQFSRKQDFEKKCELPNLGNSFSKLVIYANTKERNFASPSKNVCIDKHRKTKALQGLKKSVLSISRFLYPSMNGISKLYYFSLNPIVELVRQWNFWSRFILPFDVQANSISIQSYNHFSAWH